MNVLEAMRGRVEEIAEELGWSVDRSSDDGDDWKFKFRKGSPAGQDFGFTVEMTDNEPESLIDNIYEQYNDYDCSEEAYIWLDNTGHGKNGAPYDMKDVYEDMKACQKMILELHDKLNAEDWSKYEVEVD